MDKKEEFVGMLQENEKSAGVKQEGNKLPQYICAMIASLGAFVIGTVLAWTSPGLKFLEDGNYTTPVHIDDKQISSWVAAWTPIGAIIGALPAGIFADLIGRKYTLITFSVPWIGTWLMLLFARNHFILYVARFISGIIVGLFCAVLPMYVTEISEDSVRGSLGTLFQVFITLGILFDYILGGLESYSLLNQACAGATVVFLVGAFFLPESPMYLAKKNRKTEAEQSLRQLRGVHYDVYVEYNELRKNLDASDQSFSLSDVFTPVNLKALTIALGLMFAQQFSGVNGVIFFAEQIFKDSGASSPALCTMIVGIVQTIATVIASLLVDRAGRKILLIVSSVIMGVCLGIFGYYFWLRDHGTDVSGISWLPLACLVIFIVGFSLGLGPLPWMMSGEVLAPEIKSFGSGVAVATNWSCVAVVTFFFKPLIDTIGSACTFWIFTVVCGCAAVFALLVIPETKGKSIQQIQDELAGRKSKVQLNGNA